MPQINQLADAAYSQFFWLLLVLAIIYFGIGRMMLPKIQSTVDARDQRISGDLAAAQAAREAAEGTEAAYRARMDASRAEGLKLAQAAKVSSAKATEERMRAANEEIGAKVEAAEARIRAAADATLGEIESVAAEAAREMVERLAGVSVDSDEAARAVRNAMTHG
ncbi:MAG TPA: ATPase [Allosphingosinicella sp.]|jgi:F-type H+-transporting ATPase subunit b